MYDPNQQRIVYESLDYRFKRLIDLQVTLVAEVTKIRVSLESYISNHPLPEKEKTDEDKSI